MCKEQFYYTQIWTVYEFNFRTGRGWINIVSLVLSYTSMISLILAFVKERTYMRDYCFTIAFNHFIIVSLCMLDFPRNGAWWFSIIVGFITLVIPSEFICYQLELMPYKSHLAGKDKKKNKNKKSNSSTNDEKATSPLPSVQPIPLPIPKSESDRENLHSDPRSIDLNDIRLDDMDNRSSDKLTMSPDQSDQASDKHLLRTRSSVPAINLLDDSSATIESDATMSTIGSPASPVFSPLSPRQIQHLQDPRYILEIPKLPVSTVKPLLSPSRLRMRRGSESPRVILGPQDISQSYDSTLTLPNTPFSDTSRLPTPITPQKNSLTSPRSPRIP
jgi:hypothetical protein